MGAVGFDQVVPLGELTVRWTGAELGDIEVADEFDAGPPETPVDGPAEGSQDGRSEPAEPEEPVDEA